MTSIRAVALASWLVLAAACSTKSGIDLSGAVNEAGVSLALCGMLERYEAPLPAKARDGMVAVGTRSWTVASDARLQGAARLVAGRPICIEANLDPNGRITDCAFNAPPPNPWPDPPDADSPDTGAPAPPD